MKFPNKFKDSDDRKLVEKIYFTLVELSSQDELAFSERET